MSRRTSVLLAMLALAVSVLTPITAGAQQQQSPADRFERLSGQPIDPALLPLVADPDRRITVMVELDAAPVAVEQANAGTDLSEAAKTTIRDRIKRDQALVKARVEALGGTVVTQMQDAYNGMRVQVNAGDLAAVADTAGVSRIHSLFKYELDNSSSVPYLFTPQVWESLGLTGSDVKVAVIDTGIDYYHANFGGSGDPADYAADDRTVIEAGTFPTLKVAGGYDFAGDAYDASSDDPTISTPAPDPDPLDCHFHGSHVAGTAAGQGVLSDGSTYVGPYDSTTHANAFNVGPGMAPEATLYALKVFGCEGSTDVTVEAINWAVANDMDVINMSLGSPFGRSDDPTAVASDNAAAAGVIVVASAGNEGAGLYITGSPGSATNVISVAALDTIASVPQAAVTFDSTTITMQNSNGAPLPPGDPVLWALDNLGADEHLGCLQSDFEAQAPGDGWANKIVVTTRGVCARVDRAINGQAVGAAAVIMINTGPGFPPFEGPIAGVTIPFLGAMESDGAALTAAHGATATLTDPGAAANPGYQSLADFTSGGPRMGDSAAKPDVTAPGVSIVSSFFSTGIGGVTSSGTSMAAPHVAGLAALVRQANPGWSVEDVKAAIVNTSQPSGVANYSTRLAGAGMIDPTDATTAAVVAVGDPGTASLSFGYEEAANKWITSRQITVRNHGPSAVTYVPTVEWDTNAAGNAALSVAPGSVDVGPGQEKTVTVKLTVDVANVPAGFNTASGNVLLTGSDGSELRVPFMAVPRGRAAVASLPVIQRVRTNTSEVDFWSLNLARATGTVDSYAWGLSDPRGDSDWNDIRAVGVQSFPDAFEPGSSLGVFALNTYNMTSNASVTEWDILIDSGNDGSFDYVVIGFDLGALTTGEFDGQLASFVLDLSTGVIEPWFLAGAGINSSTVLLPVVWEVIGVNAADPEFGYAVQAFSLEDLSDAEIVDGFGVFNAFEQPVETGFFGVLERGDLISWTAGIDPAAVEDLGVMGWMLVGTENRSGNRQAQLVAVHSSRGHGSAR